MPGRGRRWVVARWVATALVLGGLVVAAARNIDELRDVDLDIQLWWLLAAIPFMVAASVVLPLAWQRTIVALGGQLAAPRAVQIWWVSQAARLVVTMVGAAIGRIGLATREGVRLEVAAGAQVVEMVLLVGWSALLGAAPGSGVPVTSSVRIVVFAGAAAGLIAIPWCAPGGLVFVRRFRRFRPDADAGSAGGTPSVDRRRLVGAEVAYGLNALLRSGAFVLLAAGLLPIGGDDVALLVAAWNLSAVAGFVGITPAGIGVREAVIVALLSDRLGLGGAAALAAAWRGWELVFEMASVAVVTVLGRRRGRLEASTSQPQSSTT